MQIDIDHMLFWMDAIRNSTNRSRTLESFWKGQIKSKLWLIENLTTHVLPISNNIVIHGGWNGVLSSLLFQSDINVHMITSIDINPECEEIANTMNKIEEMSGRFKAVTCDMIKYQYDFYPDIVINTSCEHIDQNSYDLWLKNIPSTSLIVLQSNNYYDLDEHIRCATNIDEFISQSNLKIYSAIKLDLIKYSRFMLIGVKNNV